jgi:hypothetical protein
MSTKFDLKNFSNFSNKGTILTFVANFSNIDHQAEKQLGFGITVQTLCPFFQKIVDLFNFFMGKTGLRVNIAAFKVLYTYMTVVVVSAAI